MAGSYFLSGPLPLPGGGGNTVKFTQFTANGTWTKDANCQQVLCIIWNGGGGGGSGRKGTTGASTGGYGGSGGSVMIYGAPANMFSATETITIGAGGAGGAAQTVNGTDGNNGASGGQSRIGHLGPVTTGSLGGGFGKILGGPGGSANGLSSLYGVPYRTSTITLPAASSISILGDGIDLIANGYIVGFPSTTIGAPPTDIGFVAFPDSTYSNYLYFAAGGGAGGGADAVTAQVGGNGGNILNADQTVMFAGGAGGIEGGTINGGVGANFVFPVTGATFGGAGGGGGGGAKLGGTGGTGGNGGTPGGAGGGGGGGISAVSNSGAGGNGARGEIWVYEILG